MNTMHKLEDYVTYLDELLQQVDDTLAMPPDTERAHRVLRAVLWAIRDRLELESALRFSNHLPLPFKAVFLDHWDVGERVPDPLCTIDDLVDEIVRQSPALFEELHGDRAAVKQALVAVFKVIAWHIAPSDVETELHFLPRDVQNYLKQQHVGEWPSPDSSIWLP